MCFALGGTGSAMAARFELSPHGALEEVLTAHNMIGFDDFVVRVGLTGEDNATVRKPKPVHIRREKRKRLPLRTESWSVRLCLAVGRTSGEERDRPLGRPV